MQPKYIYAGTFSPPTYGHWRIACRAAELLPNLTILCSVNPTKDNSLFTPEECKKLWTAYPLPSNVHVKTFAELTEKAFDSSNIILVRGIRDEKDLEEERSVILHNQRVFGIDKYFYLLAEDSYGHISSSLCRSLAKDLRLAELSECVAPLVVSALLEKELGAQNVFLVVGRPGSGKTTLLKFLSGLDPEAVHINTDEFSHALRPLLKQKFGEENLARLAAENEKALKAAIKEPWLKMLSGALRTCRGKNIFIEIPYAMQEDKRLYQMVGGKVIFVDGGEMANNIIRIAARGTPELTNFIEKIPGREKTAEICKKNRLVFVRVDTGDTLEETKQKAEKLYNLLKGGNLWKTCSPDSFLDI